MNYNQKTLFKTLICNIILYYGTNTIAIGQIAPNAKDTLTTKEAFLNITFSQKNQTLKPREVQELMMGSDLAYEEMSKARNHKTIADIIGCVGGFMFGWSLGSFLGSGKLNAPMLGTGAIFIGVSIPLYSSFIKRSKKAVSLYNK